ncbi:hypothetical protein [Micromonospora fluostatini]|uniref:hypothetical protein n=1 Tax=Micromonospora sp. JCM 30529 TaxID=3421643 RepID=UPI003D17875C
MRTPSVRARRVVAAVAVTVVVVLLAGGAWRAATRRPTTDDGARVHCLSTAQRAALVEAATALGLATPAPVAGQMRWSDRQGTPEQWRADRPADFDRACLALIAAAQRGQGGGGGGSPWATVLPSLLLAVVSAALAAWFSRRLATAGARRAQADALRAAAREYRLAVEPLLRHVEEALPGRYGQEDEIHRRQRDLASRLDAVATAHRGWGLPRRLGTELAGQLPGPLHDVPRGSAGSSDRPGWVRRQRTELTRLEAEVEQVAHAVESPGVVPGRVPAAVR